MTEQIETYPFNIICKYSVTYSSLLYTQSPSVISYWHIGHLPWFNNFILPLASPENSSCLSLPGVPTITISPSFPLLFSVSDTLLALDFFPPINRLVCSLTLFLRFCRPRITKFRFLKVCCASSRVGLTINARIRPDDETFSSFSTLLPDFVFFFFSAASS